MRFLVQGGIHANLFTRTRAQINEARIIILANIWVCSNEINSLEYIELRRPAGMLVETFYEFHFETGGARHGRRKLLVIIVRGVSAALKATSRQKKTNLFSRSSD